MLTKLLLRLLIHKLDLKGTTNQKQTAVINTGEELSPGPIYKGQSSGGGQMTATRAAKSGIPLESSSFNEA